VKPSECRRLQAQIDKIVESILDLSGESRLGISNLSRQSDGNRVRQRLQSLMTKFSLIQETQMQKQRETIKRQFKIVHPEIDSSRLEEYVDNPPESIFLNTEILSQVEERKNVIGDIEESLVKITNLFNDLQALLVSQQETVDRIEVSSGFSRYQIEDGGDEIRRAITRKKLSRVKIWIFCIVILFLLLITGLVLYFERCKVFKGIDVACR
jgi:syntaxin 1B/2/3